MANIERKRVTLHPLKSDGTLDLDVNLYPKTLLDGIVDREGEEVEVALKSDIPTDIVTHEELEDGLNTKVDKEDGKGLSTNDFTDLDKSKLSNIEEGAQVNVIENVVVNGTPLVPEDKTVSFNVPTNTSELVNDSGFTTENYVDTEIENLETKVAKDLQNQPYELTPQAQISDGTYPRLLKYNDNKLYLFLDNRYSVSEDKGLTWSEPIILFTKESESEASGRTINDVGNAYAFLSPNNDGRIVVIYRSLNRDTSFFSICAKVSDINGENFGTRQELFNSASGYWEPFYYKGWVYYSAEHGGSESDKAQSIYRRTISVDLNGIVSVGSSTRFLDGRNKVDTDGNVNNKTRLGMISAAPIENGHIFVFESSVNINASTPRPMVVQYCYVKHPEDNPAQPTSVVNLFLGSSGKKCEAPFVTTLDDGRIVISFQTNEKYTGYERNDFRNSQWVSYVSKRKVNYGDELTSSDFVRLSAFEYSENEYGAWGSVANIDGILYKMASLGVNTSETTNKPYGNFISINNLKLN